MTRALFKSLAFLLVPAVGSCHNTTGPDTGQFALFIGNSLTYQNDLPGTVAALARTDHFDLTVASDAIANTALIDHVNAGDGLDAINLRHWDFVVLQQGPTTLSLCHDTLVLAVQQLIGPIQKAGGQMALLMPWPAASDTANGTFDIIRESFQSAAKTVDALFFPVGEAWHIAWSSDPTLPLYGGDGYHPAPLGTYLMALVIYERISGHDVRQLPVQNVNNLLDGVPDVTVRLLQQAAHQANETYGAGTVPGLPLRPVQGPLTC
jgi:hypothetical protein